MYFFLQIRQVICIYHFLLQTILIIVLSTAPMRKFIWVYNFACTVKSSVLCIKGRSSPVWSSLQDYRCKDDIKKTGRYQNRSLL